LTNISTCESTDGCDDSDLSESYQSGIAVLGDVVAAAESGALVAAILVEAEATGLGDLVSGLSVDTVETQDPETEVIDPTQFPTAAPVTVSPPSATPTCRDSSLSFRLMYNDKLRLKSCEWVARDPNWKCDLEGVSEHCPNTCGSCDTCSDSTMVFYNINKKKTRTCSWAARQDTDFRCTISGMANTCRSTCTNCGLCKDSGVKFLKQSDKGGFVKKGCSWVGSKPSKLNIHCGFKGVASHCPNTCLECSTYACADSEKEWVFWGKNNKRKTCAWVARKPAKVNKRCANTGVKATCRETCKYVGYGLTC